MKPILLSVDIHASQATVWTAITQIEDCHLRLPGVKKIEMLTVGPVGKGTRWRETRVMFGKETTETLEIEAFNPPSEYTAVIKSCACEYRATLRVKPHASGTTLEQEFQAHALGFAAKIMGVIMMPLMLGSIRKMIQGDLDAIKLHCEAKA